jgi:hypothetical protein
MNLRWIFQRREKHISGWPAHWERIQGNRERLTWHLASRIEGLWTCQQVRSSPAKRYHISTPQAEQSWQNKKVKGETESWLGGTHLDHVGLQTFPVEAGLVRVIGGFVAASPVLLRPSITVAVAIKNPGAIRRPSNRNRPRTNARYRQLIYWYVNFTNHNTIHHITPIYLRQLRSQTTDVNLYIFPSAVC